MQAPPPGPTQPAPLDEHQRRGQDAAGARVSVGRVLVLNATFEPINVCSVRRAVVLVLKEKAGLLGRATRELHAESTTVPRPGVIRLVPHPRGPRDTPKRQSTPPPGLG